MSEQLPVIAIKLEIRRNADGEVRSEVQTPQEWHEYIWQDGNYACDCNRELFFCRMSDEDEPEARRCGDERYSVRITDSATGTVLLDEFGGKHDREQDRLGGAAAQQRVGS